MELGYDKPLYVLAFDHRGSFQKKFFGVSGAPSPQETERISDAKHVIFEGFLRALDEGADRTTSGLLVDEQFGADIGRQAKTQGLTFAMPVEKSGQDEFDFEYGEEYGKRIEEFDPTFTKVLVRFNPAGDQTMNERQTARLRELSDWLHDRGRKFLFELLVAATEEQLASVGGDADRYETEIRPGLMRETIGQLQRAGVEPDIWKIEGIDRREDCRAIADQARSGGRDNVACVVLGRGADQAAVDAWLRAGSGVPGYIGFAIGRTIWWDPLKEFVDDKAKRDDAAARISANYRRFIHVYNG
jgi:myo-inositol catabolism protein IolC